MQADAPDFEIVTEDFEEGIPGIFVYHPQHPVPFLFNFIHINEAMPKVNTEKGMNYLKDAINEEMQAYGVFQMAAGIVEGYPINNMPTGVDEPKLIEYGGKPFRLYTLISFESNVAIPCYVPYSHEMKIADNWISMESLYPVTITGAKGSTEKAKHSPYQLRTVH